MKLPEPWCSSDVAVVLPTFNEASNLPVIVTELFELPLPRLTIFVVDDNSPDATGQIADDLSDKFGADRLIVVHRPRKGGARTRLRQRDDPTPWKRALSL